MRHLLFFICAGLASCATPSAPVRAPLPTAPYEERRAAYEELRPISATVLVSIDRGRTVDEDTMYFKLGSGRTVTYPEDLLPAVAADSVTAVAAKRSALFQRKAIKALRVSPLAAGVGVGAGAITNTIRQNRDEFLSVDDYAEFMLAGAGAGLLVSLIVAGVRAGRSDIAREKAFASYDTDLRAYLNLCETKDFFYDCDQPPSQPTNQPQSMPTSSALPISTY